MRSVRGQCCNPANLPSEQRADCRSSRRLAASEPEYDRQLMIVNCDHTRSTGAIAMTRMQRPFLPSWLTKHMSSTFLWPCRPPLRGRLVALNIPKKNVLSRTFCALLLCAGALGTALAQQTPRNPTLYVQAGLGERGTDSITVGGTLPWKTWTYSLWGAELRGHWDVYLSRWSFRAAAGRSSSLMLLGVTPTLRLYPDDGRSAWFWEAGVGLTTTNHRYVTRHREFSTRFNFASHAGVGIHLGAQRQHEVVLRLQHLSNADIKHPNPGENFIQLRYAYTVSW